MFTIVNCAKLCTNECPWRVCCARISLATGTMSGILLVQHTYELAIDQATDMDFRP